MKKIPQRMCIACRQMKDKTELVRCYVSQDGSLEVDTTGKKGGRGAYICMSQECLKKAKKSNLFGKALGVTVPSEFYDELAKRE